MSDRLSRCGAHARLPAVCAAFLFSTACGDDAKPGTTAATGSDGPAGETTVGSSDDPSGAPLNTTGDDTIGTGSVPGSSDDASGSGSPGSSGGDATSTGAVDPSTTGSESSDTIDVEMTTAPVCMDEGGTGDTGALDPSCPSGGVLELGVTHATLVDQTADFQGSCAPAPQSLPDAELVFTAPHDGTFGFDTYDNEPTDTVLYVLDQDCGGQELACEDENFYAETDGKLGAAVSVDLAMGESVTVVVDARYAQQQEIGAFGLAVTDVFECPLGDLGDGTQTIEASTAFTADEFAPSCSLMAGGHDGAFTFTAPSTATYGFVADVPNAYDVALAVYDGVCGGPEIACRNGAVSSDTAHRIGVAVDLAAGQIVTVVVTGNGQAYRTQFGLRVEPVAPLGCPVADLGDQVPQVVQGTTLFSSDANPLSCEAISASPDATYLFTAAEDGLYAFDTTLSSFRTALEIRDGSCGGPSLACALSIPEPPVYAADEGDFIRRGAAAIELAAGQTVAVSVDGFYEDGGEYSLAVGRIEGPCAEIDLGMLTAPFAVSGTTSAAANASTGTCGGFTEPDVSYVWTAPAAGTYTISTDGSCFDTSLHVHETSCGGAQLKCANDLDTLQARTTIELVAGQTISIVVDGQRGESGEYVLRVDPAVTDGSCCNTLGVTGCSIPTIETCVCDLDSYCCDVEWDGQCVNEAVIECAATCA